MDDHDDFAFEPIPGLPEKLPRGETMLWQGSPEWRSLALSAFHIRKVGIYFLLLLIWKLASAFQDGASVAAMLSLSAWIVAGAVSAIGILGVLAFFYARGTIYTLTTKRIVIRSGIALPVTLNLPLSLIETADVAKEPRGAGSIALTVTKPNRVAFLVLWPNARRWHIANPQPMLRCLCDADAVAPMLARALEADAGMAGGRAAVRSSVSKAGKPTHAPVGAAFPA